MSNIIGPNVLDWISCDHLAPGDADLSTLSGFPTYEASILEFDFVPANPATSTLLFSYVFSSDEYNEWVTTPHDDVVACT